MTVRKRGYEPKKRNAHIRERKKIVLIAAEGKNKTETLYFRNFQSASYNVKFSRGNYTDPVNMINELKHSFEEMGLDASEGDIGYCLVDADIDPGKNVKIARADSISNEHISLIVSIPCFEIWYLCHYTSSTRQYASNEEVLEALKKYIPDYSKESGEMFNKLGDKTLLAIRNAQQLEEHCLANGAKPHTTSFSPSSEVYKIALKLQQ